MKLKPVCMLLPLLALCACANLPQKATPLGSTFLAGTDIVNNYREHVFELPDIKLTVPEASVSLPFAQVSVDELPMPPIELFRCGMVAWEPYPIRFWEGLKDVPHIQFTFLNSYQTWMPIEGKVYQHTVYRLGRID